jgi:hypothetical protein
MPFTKETVINGHTDTQAVMMKARFLLMIGVIAFIAGVLEFFLPSLVSYEVNPYALMWFGAYRTTLHSKYKLKIQLQSRGAKA